MFHLYHSNQVDVLKSLFVYLSSEGAQSNPLQAEDVLVQSAGMSQWLKMEVAKAQGIAANFNFVPPSSFIWDLFARVLPDVPKRSAFSKEAMTWRLMKILPQHFDDPDFSALKDYLEEDVDDKRLYLLADKIADTFDGYLVYRPDWIDAWEHQQQVPELAPSLTDEQDEPSWLQSANWQAKLWHALYQDTLDANLSKYHRANLYQAFIEKLQTAPAGSLPQLPKRLFVFGISSLPPRYLDALQALSEHIDVHLMHHNPCRYYWGNIRDRAYLAKLESKKRQRAVSLFSDQEAALTEFRHQFSSSEDELSLFNANQVSEINQALLDTQSEQDIRADVGNNLLASFGKQGREMIAQLSQIEANEVDAFVDVDARSLLSQLQQDILELQEHQDDTKLLTSEHKVALPEDDDSVQVHLCHSPMREVEVLHDKLLSLFEQDPELKPRDVIVMVSDINAYSYAISAVFGNAQNDRYIPYSLSDQSSSHETPILQAFLNLLGFPQSRFNASELIALLEVPAVMRRFELSENEFHRAMAWLEQVGVRWGLDQDTASHFDLPSQYQNTWLFGIERMLMGYAMPHAAGIFAAGEHVIASFDEVQGLDAALAGKLAYFVRITQEYLAQMAHAKSAHSWQNVLLNLLDDYFSPELEDEYAIGLIRQSLAELVSQRKEANLDTEVSLAILIKYLDDKFNQTRVSQRFLAGQVNFCTLMPMRAIPFKAVCLLGMNDGAVPRQVIPNSFDLVHYHQKMGDRSRRDDDRYLFLEALLSAEKYLYISYIGRSIVDNQEREPSVLVSELLDYCHQNYCLEKDLKLAVDDSGDALLEHLITEHSAIVFSPKNFDPNNPNCQSFAREWLSLAKGEYKQVTEFVQPIEAYYQVQKFEFGNQLQLDLKELMRFYRLPVKYFFQSRLKTNLDLVFEQVEDDEPFALSNLDLYMICDQVMKQVQALSQVNQDQGVINWQLQLNQVMSNLSAAGQLPCGHFLDLAVRQVEQRVVILLEAVLAHTKVKRAPLEIDLGFEFSEFDLNLNLTGWLGGIYESGLVRYRAGGLGLHYLIQVWIEHLAMNAQGHKLPTLVFGLQKGQVIDYKITPLDKLDAQVELAKLIKAYYQGMDTPLCFLPKTVQAAMSEGYDGANWASEKIDQDKALQAMQKAFEGGEYHGLGESSDPYVSRLWPDWSEELAESLFKNGLEISQALYLAMQLTETDK